LVLDEAIGGEPVVASVGLTTESRRCGIPETAGGGLGPGDVIEGVDSVAKVIGRAKGAAPGNVKSGIENSENRLPDSKLLSRRHKIWRQAFARQVTSFIPAATSIGANTRIVTSSGRALRRNGQLFANQDPSSCIPLTPRLTNATSIPSSP